jgi:holin-like protein
MNFKSLLSKVVDVAIGLVILLAFQFVGQTISDAFSLTLPGPVIGMLLLFVALIIVKKTPRSLSDTSAMLIRHLSLFFLPAASGIFFLGASINQELPAIMLTLVVSTLVAMIITALCMQGLINEMTKDESANSEGAE